MQALQARIESFSKTKRVKNPSKSSSHSNHKWPHPSSFKANADTLAEAGFYFNPSHDDPDNVTCFMCDKQLSDWEVSDDPFDIHWEKCGQRCCWASVRCGLRRDMDRHGRLVFPDKSRLPLSKFMEKARLETFSAGDGWIHDQSKNHGANSKKMAHAGFVYTPQHIGDDLATCLYCNVSLSGWDQDDDPMEEHRRRKEKSGFSCPFFTSDNSAASSSDASQALKLPSKAPSSKPQTKPASRSQSKSKHQDMVMPTKIHDGDPDGDYDTAESAPSSTAITAKTPRKPRSTSGSRASSARKLTAKTPRTKPRSTSRSGLRGAKEDEEAENVVEPPATIRRSARSRSKSVAQTETEDEVAPPATVKKKGRPRLKSVAKSTRQEESEIEDEEPAPPPTVKKTTRSRSKSVARSEPVEQSDAGVDLDEEETQKRSRSRAKAKAVEQTDDEFPRKSSRTKPKPQEEEAPVRKPVRTKSKAKLVENEDDELIQLTKLGTTSKTTAPIKSKANYVLLSEDEFGPVIEQPIFTPAKVSKSRQKSKAVSQEDQDGDNDDMGDYFSPASLSPPIASQPEADLPPLFIPKRTLKPVPSQSNPEVKENKKPGKPPKAKAILVVEDDAEGGQEDESNSYVPLAPVTVNPIPVAKEKVLSKARPISKGVKGGKNPLKVVDVSSDEEEGHHVEAEREKSINVKGIAQEGKENFCQFVSALASPTQPEIHPSQEKNEMKLDYSIEDFSHPNSLDVNENDVTIHPIGTEPLDVNMQDTTPQTPPRAPLPLPTTNVPLAPETTRETEIEPQQPFMPFLSKLPFTPLNELTGAELDMTVEEWIRYQMEVEYDKFKRDGERELQRFKKRAEDVRKIIDGL